MALALERGGARAGHARDQRLVDQEAEREQHRRREQDRDIGPDDAAERRLHAQEREGVEGDVHAEHHEVALGEVDHPHDAEDHREADAHQAVDRADQGARGERLQEALEQDLGVAHGAPSRALSKAARP